MKTKSIIGMMLVLLLLASLLPGCGNQNTAGESTQTTSTSAGTEEKTSKPQAKEKKEITISIALWDFADFGNDDMGKKIMNDLKIKVNIVPMGWDNYQDQIKLWAAAGNLPDITATYTADQDITRFYNWIDQGIIRSIPDDMLAKYPVTKKKMEDNVALQSVKKIKGDNYFIPITTSVKGYYKAEQTGFYYRKDWMKNVGIEKEPETLDEFYQLVKAFTEKDPDGNKKNDTYGLASFKNMKTIYNIFGHNNDDWIKEDGRYIPGYASKTNAENLAFLQKIFREKLWDPEFASISYKQALTKFSQNTVGVVLRNRDNLWFKKTLDDFFGAANPGTVPLDVIGIFGPLKKDADSQAAWPMFIDFGGNEISSKVDDEKLDRILELHEYIMETEKLMFKYGFEGKTYTMVDGVPTKLVDAETNAPIRIAKLYPSSGIESVAEWGFDFNIERPGDTTIKPAYKDYCDMIRERFNAAAINENTTVRLISTPAKDMLDTAWNDKFVQIIMSKEDAATAFNKWIQESMSKGLAKAIEEVNAKVKELGIE